MTLQEFAMWRAFDSISPIGAVRGDYQSAQVVSALYRTAGVDVSISDALLNFNGNSKKEETESADIQVLKMLRGLDGD